MTGERLRIGIVGPMLGTNPGWVPSPGEILAAHLERDHDVHLVSLHPGRMRRAMDTIWSLATLGRSLDLAIVFVFSGAAFAMADLSSLLVRRTGKPLVLALHGGGLPRFARDHPGWARRVLARADALVVPSSYLQDALDLTGHPIRVIPNVIDFPEAPGRNGSPMNLRILWMRTYSSAYRPATAVAVLESVRRSIPDATLTMAGQDRGLLDSTLDLAREKGLEGSTRILGFLDPAAKDREFRAHDLFLNTTVIDNAPVSLLEATAFGLPIVSTAAGGIPHMYADGVDALLAPPDDVEGLARCVERLALEPGLGPMLVSSARRLLEEHSWERVSTLWEALFREVVDRD